jgi:predicted metal-dependent peptidase
VDVRRVRLEYHILFLSLLSVSSYEPKRIIETAIKESKNQIQDRAALGRRVAEFNKDSIEYLIPIIMP